MKMTEWRGKRINDTQEKIMKIGIFGNSFAILAIFLLDLEFVTYDLVGIFWKFTLHLAVTLYGKWRALFLCVAFF